MRNWIDEVLTHTVLYFEFYSQRLSKEQETKAEFEDLAGQALKCVPRRW